MQITSVDVVATISASELLDIIDALEHYISSHSKFKVSDSTQNARQVQEMIKGLKQFQQLMSVVLTNNSYIIRPQQPD